MSIADAVTKVYRERRNKLAHGEVAGLFEGLSQVRTVGDVLLMNLFDVVTFELSNVIDHRDVIFTLPEEHAYRALIERMKQRLSKSDDSGANSTAAEPQDPSP